MSPLHPSPEEINAKAWHYVGYPGFAQSIATNLDLLVLRRFDALAARLLLRKQWQLVKVEAQLSQLDLERSRGNDEDINNGSFESDDSARQLCLDEIDRQLKDYYDFLSSYVSIRGKPDASVLAKQDVHSWLESWDSPVLDEMESAYLHEHDDLLALTERPRVPLGQVYNKLLGSHLNPRQVATATFSGSNYPKSGRDSHTQLHRRHARIRSLANVPIIIAGFLMLVAPMWILIYMQSRQLQLAVITIFIFVFLALLQLVTAAKSFESLAATAAYSAILVVFLQTTPANFFSNN